MALNSDRSGHIYPSYLYEVCGEKVAEYARATFTSDAAFSRADGGVPPQPAPVVPPTFAACITSRVIPLVVDDPELGGHWNLLHTGQSFRWARPVRVGDVLRCTPRIADLKARRGMDLLTVAVDVTSAADDAPVLEATLTLVFFDPSDS